MQNFENGVMWDN